MKDKKGIRDVHSKAAATGISGAAIAVLIWVLSQFGVDMPPEIAAGVVTLVAAAGAWLVGARWLRVGRKTTDSEGGE